MQYSAHAEGEMGWRCIRSGDGGEDALYWASEAPRPAVTSLNRAITRPRDPAPLYWEAGGDGDRKNAKAHPTRAARIARDLHWLQPRDALTGAGPIRDIQKMNYYEFNEI
jgi:hypothetical protein